eukprot:scaffold494_cov245-Pinguiococcus_pyrenoidosus.AAC.12
MSPFLCDSRSSKPSSLLLSSGAAVSPVTFGPVPDVGLGMSLAELDAVLQEFQVAGNERKREIEQQLRGFTDAPQAFEIRCDSGFSEGFLAPASFVGRSSRRV